MKYLTTCLALFVAGCATRDPHSPEIQFAVATYRSCVFGVAEHFAKTSASASEAAMAAHGQCTNEFHRATGVFASHVSQNDMTRYDSARSAYWQERFEGTLRNDVFQQAVGLVIELRSQKDAPTTTGI